MINVRKYIQKILFRLIDIPNIDDFDEKDQKHINDWLLMSSGHQGFYKYLKARDRSFAQTMVNLDIRTQSDDYLGMQNRRLEILRLKARAERIKKQKDG